MRRLVRDYLYRSTDPEFTFYVWQSVRDNEEKSIFPYSHSCNYFIDSTMPYEVGMLKPYLERILAKISKESKFYNEAAEVLRQLQHVQPIPSAYMTPNSLYKEFI
jgi:uridine kinase